MMLIGCKMPSVPMGVHWLGGLVTPRKQTEKPNKTLDDGDLEWTLPNALFPEKEPRPGPWNCYRLTSDVIYLPLSEKAVTQRPASERSVWDHNTSRHDMSPELFIEQNTHRSWKNGWWYTKKDKTAVYLYQQNSGYSAVTTCWIYFDQPWSCLPSLPGRLSTKMDDDEEEGEGGSKKKHTKKIFNIIIMRSCLEIFVYTLRKLVHELCNLLN